MNEDLKVGRWVRWRGLLGRVMSIRAVGSTPTTIQLANRQAGHGALLLNSCVDIDPVECELVCQPKTVKRLR